MLELLNQLLEEARAQHEDMLWLAFYRRNGGDRSRLEVQETEFDVADALNFTGAEAIGILRDLGNDGYVRLQLDAYGFAAGAGLVGVILPNGSRSNKTLVG